jgi:hypothetical protein
MKFKRAGRKNYTTPKTQKTIYRLFLFLLLFQKNPLPLFTVFLFIIIWLGGDIKCSVSIACNGLGYEQCGF